MIRGELWIEVRRVKPPWKVLAQRPPGLRVVLAARPAEWALSQTSVCSLLLELLAGWMWGGVRWDGGGGGGGWRAGAFRHKPASAPTSYSGKTTTTQYHSKSSARSEHACSEQADSVSQHEWVTEVICHRGNGKCQQIHSWFEVAST